MDLRELEAKMMKVLKSNNAMVMKSKMEFTKNRRQGTYFPYMPLDVTIPHKLLHLVEDRGYVLRKNILHNLLPGEK